MLLRFGLNLFFVFSVALWPFGASREKVDIIRESELELPLHSEAYQDIRVAVFKQLASATIETKHAYKIYDDRNAVLLKGERIVGTTVKPDKEGIYLGAQLFHTKVMRLEIAKGTVVIEKKEYEGSVVIHLNEKGKLDIIVEVPLETYLKGVLPKEISPKWPFETLKAQAIASRTYALFKMIEKKDELFDVSADVSSQVFGGSSVHHEESDRAVDATRGMIMTYRGKIFPAFFHANSGGYTTHADYVWDIKKHPSLQPVDSSFSLGEKHSLWHDSFELKEIEEKLKKQGFKVSGITDIKDVDYDQSGRPHYFLIRDDHGKIKILSSEFRMALDPFKFKSTLLTSINKKDGIYTFRGRGWGHGVGMCQYGSKKLGSLGYSFKDILQHYYPGSNLRDFYST